MSYKFPKILGELTDLIAEEISQACRGNKKSLLFIKHLCSKEFNLLDLVMKFGPYALKIKNMIPEDKDEPEEYSLTAADIKIMQDHLKNSNHKKQ